MEIEIFTLCDFAQDTMGKLTIVGTVDFISTPVFPTVHPHCSVALRIRFSDKEVGQHSGSILFTNPNGEEVLPKLPFNLNVAKGPNGYTTVNMVLNAGNLQFKTPGKHVIQLHIDDEWRSGLSLFLVQAQNRAA
jgi:hypothetical protein